MFETLTKGHSALVLNNKISAAIFVGTTFPPALVKLRNHPLPEGTRLSDRLRQRVVAETEVAEPEASQ
jgi:hypothetical protein